MIIDAVRSARINTIWYEGGFIGSNRPVVRATVQRAQMKETILPAGTMRTFLFGQERPIEIPTVRQMRRTQTIAQDAATCTLTFLNTQPVGIGVAGFNKDVDQPGYFSFDRGAGIRAGRYAYEVNTWSYRVVPDRVLRTYEGYGFNPLLTPDQDPNLILTGTWLIDTVEMDATNKTITLTCRDLGALLLDLEAVPPIIPTKRYPLSWQTGTVVPAVTTTVQAPIHMNYFLDRRSYLHQQSVYFGHKPQDAFDTSSASYWLTPPYTTASGSDHVEWIEGFVNNLDLGGLFIWPNGYGYQIYISVMANGVWQGTQSVPAGTGSDASIPYIVQGGVTHETYTKGQKLSGGRGMVFQFPRINGKTDSNGNYHRVTRVRVTVVGPYPSQPSLYPSGPNFGTALRSVSGFRTDTRVVKAAGVQGGDYKDYSDIVKILCAWGGFYWPRPYAPSDDPALGRGRTFGDFEISGTTGSVPLPADQFDKKPLMDCVAYVRDILGWNFFVGPDGGVIFRTPNIHYVGNNYFEFADGTANTVTSQTSSAYAPRTPQMLVIDEKLQLKQYTATLSNKDKRKSIFVGTVDGKYGFRVDSNDAVPSNQLPPNIPRVASWTDHNFASNQECQLMAQLIRLRLNQQYRTGKSVVPANPNLQVDDQVLIFERVTSEAYVHYVTGIDVNFDADQGVYDMTLDHHWLGETPNVPGARWHYDLRDLDNQTQQFLRSHLPWAF